MCFYAMMEYGSDLKDWHKKGAEKFLAKCNVCIEK